MRFRMAGSLLVASGLVAALSALMLLLLTSGEGRAV